MISLSIYKFGVPVGLLAYYAFRLFRIYILKSDMEVEIPQSIWSFPRLRDSGQSLSHSADIFYS